jgi:hypothetical protein
MAMAGVEWANVYYYSEGRGSVCTTIPRDREYFRLLWQVVGVGWGGGEGEAGDAPLALYCRAYGFWLSRAG